MCEEKFISPRIAVLRKTVLLFFWRLGKQGSFESRTFSVGIHCSVGVTGK